jgi:hypothetical protein
MLEGSTPESSVSSLVARGTVTEAEGGFALRLQLDSTGASETKTMDAGTCETLADAFALVVAFTFDPSVGQRRSAAVAARAAEHAGAGTTAAATAAPRREVRQPSPESSPTRLLAGPLVALGAGALPFPAYGLGAKVAVERGLRWELAGMLWPKEPSAPVGTDASHAVGAGVWLADLQPSACLSFAGGAVAPCVGADLGALQARGTGVPVSGSGASWWLALTAGISLRAPLTPGVGLRFRLDVGVPIWRPAFMLENVGSESSVQAFRPAPVTGIVSFEPEFQLFSTEGRESRHDSH